MPFRERDPRTGEEILITPRGPVRSNPPTRQQPQKPLSSVSKYQRVKDIYEQRRQEQQQKQPETLSRQQMQTKTAVDYGVNLRGFVLQRNINLMRQRSIKPDEQYVMQEQGPTWSKGQIFTGRQIQDIYKGSQKESTLSFSQYQRQQGQTLKQLGQYPKGTIFTPTKEGYTIKIPETEQLKFSETAIKQYESLPPGLSNIGLTGFYFGSNIAAIGKGISDFLGIGKHFDVAMAWQLKPPGSGAKEFTSLIASQKYGVRYTSWGAYLPGGIKGETKLLEKHPIEAAIGNIGAEAVQWWAGGKLATIGAQKIIIPAFSRGVSKLPKISSQFTRAVPLAPYSGRFLGKLSGTTVGKNVGLFAKGYRPALVIGSGTSKITTGASSWINPATGLESTAKGVSQITPYTLKLSRRFLSPSEYQRASEELVRKLGTKSIEIGFPTTKYVGRESLLVGTYTKTSYAMRGVLSKRLVKTGKYYRFETPALQMSPYRTGKAVMTTEQFERYLSSHGVIDVQYFPGKWKTEMTPDTLGFIKQTNELPYVIGLRKGYTKGWDVIGGETREQVLRHELTHPVIARESTKEVERLMNSSIGDWDIMSAVSDPVSKYEVGIMEWYTDRLTQQTRFFRGDWTPLSVNKKPLNLFGEEIIERSPKQYGSMYRTNAPSYGYYRGNKLISKSSSIPALESEITTPFQMKYYAFKQTWGNITPEPKAWMQGYRQPRSIIKETTATQRLVPELQLVKKAQPWSSRLPQSYGISIPEEYLITRLYPTVGYAGARLGAMKWAYEQRSMQYPETRQIQSPVSKFVYGGFPALSFKRIQSTMQIPGFKTDLYSMQRFDVSSKQMKTTVPLMKTPYKMDTMFYPPYLPRKGLSGGGSGGSLGLGGFSSYRFREFKIPSLLELKL